MSTVITRRGPRQLIEGEGTLPGVGLLASELGRRVLVVSDPIIIEQPGYAEVMAALDEAGLEVETFVDPAREAPLEVVERCASRAIDCRADLLVAVGGGTVLDVAKAAAVLVTHGGQPGDYYGENQVPGAVLPIIAIPTTAGTGSEVTTVAVLSDPERILKVGISSVYLMPTFSICDPRMTYTCPPTVTAYAGIDAVCHAVEAYTAVRRSYGWREVVEGVFVGKNPVSDEYALKALHLLNSSLVAAVEHGDDTDARAAVMRGATAAGVAFGHAGTAGPHALQYPVGAATKTPHGLGVGLLLPYVLTRNKPLIQQELVELATCIGLEADDGDSAEAFIEWTVELAARIGVPVSLREIGVERTQLRWLAEEAVGVTRLLQNNPGDNSVEGLEAILNAAWEGDRDRLR